MSLLHCKFPDDRLVLFQGGIVSNEDGEMEFEPVKPRGQENSHVIKKRWTANVVRTLYSHLRIKEQPQLSLLVLHH